MPNNPSPSRKAGPFVSGPVSIQVQSILYNLPVDNIVRALEYVERAAQIAIEAGIVTGVDMAYGDCSPKETLDGDKVSELRVRFPAIRSIAHTFFDANLGSAEGHNRLIDKARADLIMILNPDILISPNTFVEMLKTLGVPGVGAAEARQVPVEHPKDFDRDTGETSWASTACLLVPTKLAKKIGKFDSNSFFLYCDDVDFSWRIRLAGYSVIYQPHVAVFHDKRLSSTGNWIATTAERYYSAEAALFLMYKYSREDLLKGALDYFHQSGDENLIKAARTFDERREAGSLPAQLDSDHRVAQFINGAYAAHRFVPV